jgi:hypothetical protein
MKTRNNSRGTPFLAEHDPSPIGYNKYQILFLLKSVCLQN